MALALGKAGKLGLCFPALPSVALGKEGENAIIFWFFAFHQHKQRNHIYINT
jgi:uncharacterized protein YqgC (DUF456 family)